MEKCATQWMKEFPESSFKKEIEERDPIVWTNEGKEDAIRYSYNDIQEGVPPSDAYVERGRKVCRKRIAIAGYRLAQAFRDSIPVQKKSIE